MFWFLGIVFNIWIIFFGGAERLENTFLGYLEFGFVGEKAVYIKVFAWLSILGCIYALFFLSQ